MSLSESQEENLPEDSWKVRPCEMYREEYKDCTKIRARFHQYFINGEIEDCKQWKDDYDNCMSWRKTHQIPFLEAVIKSEQKRKLLRLTDMLNNDIWKLRSEPLSKEEWNKPLPDWMQDRYSISYLQVKQKQEEGKAPHVPFENWQCNIL